MDTENYIINEDDIAEVTGGTGNQNDINSIFNMIINNQGICAQCNEKLALTGDYQNDLKVVVNHFRTKHAR